MHTGSEAVRSSPYILFPAAWLDAFNSPCYVKAARGKPLVRTDVVRPPRALAKALTSRGQLVMQPGKKAEATLGVALYLHRSLAYATLACGEAGQNELFWSTGLENPESQMEWTPDKCLGAVVRNLHENVKANTDFSCVCGSDTAAVRASPHYSTPPPCDASRSACTDTVMARARQQVLAASVVPMLSRESVYVGIDIGKSCHVAGFVSTTLLHRHHHFDACPSLKFENSREGFRALIDRIQEYVPLEQCYVLMERTGHYHRVLEQYMHELDIAV